MIATRCVKCGGELDVGRLESGLVYKSETQGFFSSGYRINHARACKQCGYIELYINPEKLKKLGEFSTQLA